MDDLIQVGSIDLWKAVAGYDLSSDNKFLPCAVLAIRHAMSGLVRQYSKGKDTSSEIASLHEIQDGVGKNQEAPPGKSQAERILIDQERVAELPEAMDALPDRGSVYVQLSF